MGGLFDKPPFGNTIQRQAHPDAPDDIVERHYRHGGEVLTIFSKEEPILVESKDDAYAVIASGLNLLDNDGVNRIVFEVEKDLRTGEFRRVVQRFEVGRESK